MLGEYLFVDAWAPVVALEIPDRGELDEVLVAATAGGEQHEVRVVCGC